MLLLEVTGSSVATMNGNGENLFTGHGGPMPTSRAVNAGFFGTVDDAFSSRSLFLPAASHQPITSPDTPTVPTAATPGTPVVGGWIQVVTVY